MSVPGFQGAISLHRAIKTGKAEEIYKSLFTNKKYTSNFFQNYVSLKLVSWSEKTRLRT